MRHNCSHGILGWSCTMKFESGNDPFSSADPSSPAFFTILLRLSPFLAKPTVSDYLSSSGSSPVRYTISRYLIAHMISGSSTFKKHTRASSLVSWRICFFFLAPLRWTKCDLSPSLLLLAYHLNNANGPGASKSRRDNLYCNYNKALCAPKIQTGRRSHTGLPFSRLLLQSSLYLWHVFFFFLEPHFRHTRFNHAGNSFTKIKHNDAIFLRYLF